MDFSLVPWKMDYVQSLAKHANNLNVAANLRDVFPYPYTVEDAITYVNACIAQGQKKQLSRAILVNGEAVGSIGLFLKDDVYCKSAELGYWLGEAFWGNGIMTSAVMQVCKEAFLRFEIVRIFAEPFAHNLASRHVLEKAGFQLEGILRNSVWKRERLYDSCIYALLKGENLLSNQHP